MPPRARLPLCLLLCSTLLASPALAQQEPPADPPPSEQALVDEGTRAFLANDFAAALTAFERAYAINASPDLLYNLARVHEALGHTSEAMGFYERFIKEPNVDTDARADAVKRADILASMMRREREEQEFAARQEQARLEREQRAKEAEREEQERLAREAAARQDASADTTTPPPSDTAALPPQVVEPAPRRASPVGWVLLGLGGVSAGVGTYFALQSNQSRDTIESRCATVNGDFACPMDVREVESQMRQDALFADIGFGVGAGLALGGLVTLLVTRKGASETSILLDPGSATRPASVGFSTSF